MTGQVQPQSRRILFLNPISDVYGAEVSLLSIVQLLPGNAWQPCFVIPQAGPFEAEIRRRGWPVEQAPLPMRGKLWRIWPAMVSLATLIRRRRVDLVHLNLHFAWPVVSGACLLAGVPFIIHVRNMMALRGHGRTRRKLFRRAAAYICISEAVRDRMLASDLADAPTAGRTTVIHDGRDLRAIGPGDRERFRRELRLEPATPLIGMVARLEPMKGQDTFLEAAREVARRIPAAKFVLVGATMRPGDATYRRQLDELAARPPLEGRVSFLGYRTDVPDVLAGLDCFVHSSRRGAFVSVLIEAMAAGVPIVASDVDGIPECVGRDGAAELVGSLDPAAFADAIVRVVTDPAHARRMIDKARDRVQRYDAAPLARATEAVFRRVLAE